jgi:predicted ferric reductase/Ca2+-binding EF-hand superfamily protein
MDMDPRAELDRLATAFAQAAGASGLLTTASFQQALELQSEYVARHLFRLFDRDGNGTIERGEFVAAIERLLGGTTHDKLTFLFRVHDQDDDGSIARLELERLIHLGMAESTVELPEGVVEQMIDALFEAADRDHDGRIGFDEFAAVLAGFPELLARVTRADAIWRTLQQRGPATAEASEPPMTPVRRAAHWIENHGVEFVFLILWVAINVALFFGAVVRYRAAGANGFVQLARGCGACLNFDAALLLVPMLRRFLGWVRAQRFSRFVPVDHAVAFHKLVGHTLWVLALVHTLAHIGNYLIGESPLTEQLFGTKAGLSGFVLLIVFAIMWACALEPIRRAGLFELFHHTHLLYFVFFVVLLIHGPVWWLWAFTPLGAWVAERILRAETRSKQVAITTQVLPSRVTKLRFAPPKGWKHRAGDYLFINIPAIARFEWHPFTISSAPEREGELTLHVRSLGNWTRALAKLAGTRERGEDPQPLLGRVDGPYGTPSVDIFAARHVVLIGAGIGVTPFAAILDSILQRRRRGDQSLQLERVHFVWVNRDQYAFEWFTELLAALEAEDHDGLLDVHIYMSGGREQLDAAALELAREVFHAKTRRDVVTGLRARTRFGRPDWEALLTEFLREHAPARVEVFMCGPHALAKELAPLCGKLGMGFRQEVF